MKRIISTIIAMIIGAIIAAAGAPIVCLAEETQVEIVSAQTDEGHWDHLGTYKLTAYCPCRKCCGKWSGGPAASGKMPQAGRTIAVSGLPFGTHVWIDGMGEYVVEDRGVRGKHIDIYMDSHSTARACGVQYAGVSRWVED